MPKPHATYTTCTAAWCGFSCGDSCIKELSFVKFSRNEIFFYVYLYHRFNQKQNLHTRYQLQPLPYNIHRVSFGRIFVLYTNIRTTCCIHRCIVCMDYTSTCLKIDDTRRKGTHQGSAVVDSPLRARAVIVWEMVQSQRSSSEYRSGFVTFCSRRVGAGASH